MNSSVPTTPRSPAKPELIDLAQSAAHAPPQREPLGAPEKNSQAVDPRDPHALSILRHIHGRMTKEHRLLRDGSYDTTGYPRAKYFTAETARVTSAEELHEVLVQLNGDIDACVIRGAHTVADPQQRRRRRSANHEDCPRCWVMVDFDEIITPVEIRGDFAKMRAHVLSRGPEELRDVSSTMAFSASAGLGEWEKTKCHMWFMLSTPVDNGALKMWAADVLARGGEKIDTALFNVVQVHYTAAPIFKNCPDPVGSERLKFMRGERDAADLSKWQVLYRAQLEQERLAKIAREEARERLREESRLKRAALERMRRENGARFEAVSNRLQKRAGRGQDIQAKLVGHVDRACDVIRTAPSGKSSMTMVQQSYWIGGLCANYPHLLDAHVALHRLMEAAAQRRGHDTDRQVQNGFRAGFADPVALRTPRERALLRSIDVGASMNKPLGSGRPQPPVSPEAEVEVLPPLPALSLKEAFAHNAAFAASALKAPGASVNANPCGTGKTRAVASLVAQAQGEHGAEILWLAPTQATRREAFETLVEHGADVVEAVTRTRQSCPRLAHYNRAASLRPEGGAIYCNACSLNPSRVGQRKPCGYLSQKTPMDRPPNVATHAHFASRLIDGEVGADVVVIDEDPVGLFASHETLSIEQLAMAMAFGDVVFTDAQQHAALAGLMARSLGSKLGQPLRYITTSVLAAAVDAGSIRVSGTFKAADSVLKALSGPRPPDDANVPTQRALEALADASVSNWEGAYIYHGRLHVPWIKLPKPVLGQKLIHIDATTTPATAKAFHGPSVHYERARVGRPEGLEVIRVNANVSTSSTRSGALSKRLRTVWEAVREHYDSPHTLHASHKAWFDASSPQSDFLKSLQGPAIWHGGTQARASNQYKHCHTIVIDSWHVPRHAIDAKAYLLGRMAQASGVDDSDIDWIKQAEYQLVCAPIIQLIERIRTAHATAELPIKVVVIDQRPFELLGGLFEDAVVADPGEFVLTTTGRVCSKTAAETLVGGVLRANDGLYAPALDTITVVEALDAHHHDGDHPVTDLPYSLGQIRNRVVHTRQHDLRRALGDTWKGEGREVHKVHGPDGTGYALLVSKSAAKTLTAEKVASYLRALRLGWASATYTGSALNLGLVEELAAAASALPAGATEWTAAEVYEAVGARVGLSGLTVARKLRGWKRGVAFLKRLIGCGLKVLRLVKQWLCDRRDQQLGRRASVELCLVAARPPPK